MIFFQRAEKNAVMITVLQKAAFRADAF